MERLERMKHASPCLVSDIDLNDLNGAPVLSGAQQS